MRDRPKLKTIHVFARSSPKPSRASRPGAKLVARLIAAATALLVFPTEIAAAGQQTGRVTQVVDGHSLDVLMKTQRLRVRIAGIDAPQGQLLALRSRQSLVQLCGGEVAAVEPVAISGKGSVVAHVACGGTDAGSEQIRRGMARLSGTPDAALRLRALEDEARAAHRGVWSTQTP
jgi:endonuclease YncB( thermonuclease family)